MSATAATVPLLSDILHRGLSAFRQNAAGMALIILLGILILGGYATLPQIRDPLDRLAAWKVEIGWLYPTCSMALVAGLIPIALRFAITRQAPPWRCAVIIALYWPYRGMEIDLLYRGLGAVVGHDATLATVAMKVVIDMAIYVPCWALPLYLLAMAWQQGEAPLALLREGRFWRERYLPGVLANWLLWVPAVAIIYALPAGLQLPVQNLFMVIWIFIVELIARR